MGFEICVVPFWGQGHILPCIELCHHLAQRNIGITLMVPSTVATSLPSSLLQHPLLRITQFTSPPPHDIAPELEHILAPNNTTPPPVCAIVDIMMSCSLPVFAKLRIPTIAFFTSAACSAAMELATWKAHPFDLKPGHTLLLPGLPQDMAITHCDLEHRPGPHHPPPPPPPPPHHGGGAGFPPPGKPPPKLGDPPLWVEDIRDAIALLINTCDDLEHPFIDYLANHVKKPVWGVGPLLPEQFWNPTGSAVRDGEVRSNRESSVTEEEVVQWLDSKARGSVLYISFGTEVGPSLEEYEELGRALKVCEHPFIWVIQPSSSVSPNKEGHFGERGLIIKGWAPQLLILSHPCMGGFLSHCGWNSAVEGLGCGVPFLAWPIRGDQYHNAKLLVSHLKVAYMITKDVSHNVTKDAIVEGINKLMRDQQMKTTAETLSANLFHRAFPTTSSKALDDFKDYIVNHTLA